MSILQLVLSLIMPMKRERVCDLHVRSRIAYCLSKFTRVGDVNLFESADRDGTAGTHNRSTVRETVLSIY